MSALPTWSEPVGLGAKRTLTMAQRYRPRPPVDSRLVQDALLAWYLTHRRDLPWRRTRDPYAILVSETMLQQTQAARVVPHFVAWLERWPTIQALAAAPRADVISAWQGLGYNRRAAEPASRRRARRGERLAG